MTVKAWLDLWMDVYVTPLRSASTAAGYRYAFAHLSDALLSCDVTDDDLYLLIQRDCNRVSAVYPRQAQIMYAGLHAAMTKAVKVGKLEVSPMMRVDKPYHRKRGIDYLQPDELVALIGACDGLPSRAVIVLMALLGLRLGEALAIGRNDVATDRLVIDRQVNPQGDVVKLKTVSSHRVLPYPPALAAMVGTPVGVTRKIVYRDLDTACDRAQVHRITPHGLRHTYASMAIRGGVQMRVLQQLMGHSSYSVTADTYAHVYAPEIDAAELLIIGQMAPVTRLEIV